jgi:putative transposase
MGVSCSAYYDWKKRPGKLITADELMLYRRCKALFHESRQSLGSRQMMKKLRKEGFEIGRYKTSRIMAKLNLKVYQRQAYKVTTMRKHSHRVVGNILDQQNQVWAGDVTYLRTAEGWMYLAIVMDLYSRRIIGWSINKRMTVSLVNKAMLMAINTRQPKKGVILHSDRGSQYTSNKFQTLLSKNGFIPSMIGKGACWDNAVVERFFGSLKHEWLFNVYHLTRGGMKKDVQGYIKYYNQVRLHTANGDQTPVGYENSLMKVSGMS